MAEGAGNMVMHNMNMVMHNMNGSVNYSTSWCQNQSRATKNLQPLWVSVSRSCIVCLVLRMPIVMLVDGQSADGCDLRWMCRGVQRDCCGSWEVLQQFRGKVAPQLVASCTVSCSFIVVFFFLSRA